MKILHIITGLATGGAEVMLHKLLERSGSGWTNQVISLTGDGEIGERIRALGIPVATLGMRPGLPGPLRLARLVRHIRRSQPDLVQTWMYHADLLGGVAARLAGVRALAWNIRNSDLSPATTRWTTRIVVRLCAFLSGRIPARIVCCSEVARAIHEELGYDAAKFVVIPNGFDLARFRPDDGARLAVRRELGVATGAPLVGLIARYDPQKNHHGFLAAAAELHAARPEVHFLLAGQGIEEGNRELAEAIARRGLDPVVHLLGLRADVPRLMAALDLLISASAYGEAFPNVLGEAMACGVPCAVTDVGDSAVIVGETGRLATVGDMPALAAAMEELLGLPAETRHRLAEQCRARVEAEYEIGRVVHHYHELYGRMAGMAPARNPVR